MTSLRCYEVDEKRGEEQASTSSPRTTGRKHDSRTERPADAPELPAKAPPQAPLRPQISSNFRYDFWWFFSRAQAFGEALRKDRDCLAEKGTTKKEKARERASGGTRKNAALSRLVTKRVLARLARARKLVAKLRQGIRKISRKDFFTFF